MPHLLPELFIFSLGLAVGSFLNVVIFRLPRGLSVAQPRWSFCPDCETPIAWYDNLPVISWLRLRGRCRACRRPISAQYPLVEAATALLFVAVYHLLFVAQARSGIAAQALLEIDWPYLLVWLVLTAALIAVATMDIVSYSLDIRVTEFAVGVACLLHAVWKSPSFHLPTADSPWGAGAFAAFLVMLFLLWRTVWKPPAAASPHETDEDPGSEPDPADASPAATPDADSTRQYGIGAIVLMFAAAAYLILIPALGSARELAGVPRVCDPIATPIVLGLIFVLMSLAASRDRPADSEVHDAVEDEAPESRAVALSELRWLLPIILAFAGAAALVAAWPAARMTWSEVMHFSPKPPYVPFAGIVFAMHGAVLAAAAGWAMRIGFTVLFGREAFGIGDIYILGAAGAAAGLDIALAGLILAVAFAMLSWLHSQFRKSTSMLQFGPPLALGFFAALWLDRPIHELFRQYSESILLAAREQPRLLWILAGVLLIGFCAAVLAARAVRIVVEGPAARR